MSRALELESVENSMSENKRDKSPYRNVDKTVESLLRELIKKRGILKGRLTKFAKHISSVCSDDSGITSKSRIDLNLRTKGAALLFSEFNDIQSKIEENVSESNLEEQMSQRELFENAYYDALAQAECALAINYESDTSGSRSNFKSVKLPTIPMPKFDGNYENFLEFRDKYLSLLHKSNELTDIQKFHYLKSSLSGSAAVVIDALECTSDNYAVAWELILNRYNNNRLLVQNHVRSIFNIQPLQKESHQLIRNLIDSVLKNIRALKILGEPTDSWDTLIIYIVGSKLDKVTERQWEQHRGQSISSDNNRKLTLEDIMNFLKDRADMLESLQFAHSNTQDNKKQTATPVKALPSLSSQCNVSSKPHKSQTFKKSCLMCNKNHPLYSCDKFINADHKEKLKLVSDNQLCKNCLRSGHTVEDCRYGPCRKCNQKHNSLIHSDEIADSSVILHSSSPHQDCILSENVNTTYSQSQPPIANVVVNKAHTHTQHVEPDFTPVLLSTAVVQIKDKDGRYHSVCALLDSGSQRCFVTKSLCELIKTQTIQSTHTIHGVGNSISQSTEMCDIEILSRNRTYSTKIRCHVMPRITSTMPGVCKQRASFNIPGHIQLADPQFLDLKSIDILIGADRFWDLIDNGKMQLPNGPILQSTKLGWIISGPIYNTHSNRHIQSNFAQTLDAQLKRFWELEELPTDRDTHTDEERACENHFIHNTKRMSDGRFCVRLPLKQDPDSLGESFMQANRRFLALEKRLQRSQPDYKKLYIDFMHEYESLGHMTRISTFETPHYFLPHHGVFREHSSTTKLRVVFDASAASSSGKSLNDIQMVGPAIQGNLFEIILRFRLHLYVACADIEKCYRQCLVSEQDRNLQLILWRDEPSQEIGIYRLNTVTYGTASAPYLSVRCLKQLAYECDDPEVRRMIEESFYVDDLVSSHNSKPELLELCKKLTATLKSGCFPLRKWVFNFATDDEFNPIDESKELSLGDSAHSKTLGLGWYHKKDELHFNTQFESENQPLTKREILSKISQIFDPLGLVSPAVIVVKVLLQQLWLSKIGWDDVIPNDVARTWDRFVLSLPNLNTLRIPRHVIGTDPIRVELHIFTDSSQTAYGCSIYCRTVNKDLSVEVRLLCAKGKVAPVKPVSIPRLELCGALLGARLYDKVQRALHYDFESVVFWTDSTIVLGWLRMSPNLLKTFVQNRTAEIHELTKELPWRHVSGKVNPADLVSRGVSLENLSSSTLWWTGPDFLRDPSFTCPDSSTGVNSDITANLPETKSAVNSLVANDTSDFFPYYRFSQYNRMTRAVAYMLRFLHNARVKTNRRTGLLSVQEIDNATKTIIRWSQLESFPDEYEKLRKNRSLGSKGSTSKLNLFLDKENIIRVGGRLENSSEFTYEKKHPILIAAKHHVSTLLFRHEHKQLMHSGPQSLLFHLRESWWPIGGRNAARKVVHDCVTCKRIRAKTLTPLMGNLPTDRITPSFPFERTGVDYAGPILILNRKGRGAQLIKSYICIFICFTTRAIHLELASDLSTDAYLLALKRFVSRRNKPSVIYSDNGKNFVGLKNEFMKFISQCNNDIVEYATSQNIQFKFIPVYAAHFGGFWERGVRSCKHHLRRVVGNAHLTFEELTTVLSQIEAVLNSRPLSPMSSDPEDYLPLTPAHFLVGRTLTSPATADLTDVPAQRLTRFQRAEQIQQHFWARWNKEYISELQTRIKWRESTAELQPDTLVIIKDINLPPLRWRLGRILKTIPGKDGIARVADIRTSSGIIRRAYTSICPLVEPSQAEDGLQRDNTS